jgi:hypothetical protein
MKKRTDADKNTPKRDESLEDQIYDALIERGWLIPQTEEDVLRAERALAQAECSPLPPELADPYRIIDRLDDDANVDVVLEALAPGECAAAAPSGNAANAEATGAQAAHVSVLAELRARTKLPASQIALKMDVPVPFLSAVGRYPKVVPISWRRELDARAERKLGTDKGVVMSAFERPYQAQMAASRDGAYHTEQLTPEKILDRSGMDEKNKRYWLALAAEGRS